MDATQKQINGMLGISDEVFAKHNPSAGAVKAKAETGGLTDTQLMINKALGLSEETWQKYGPQGTQSIGAKRDEVVTIIPKLVFRGQKEVQPNG